ncbi:MAG: hypothetical protein AB1567_00035 [bacterium]
MVKGIEKRSLADLRIKSTNGRRIVEALIELGFKLDKETKEAIIQGKDFIQIKSGPFDIDLVFAPDGLEDYDRAKERAVWVEKLPVAHISDIIKSKEAAKRERDIRDLPFLTDRNLLILL